MRHLRFIPYFFLMAAFTVYSQISISGKVTSAMGTPVKGAIVKLLSAKLADTTDSNGNYSLGSTNAMRYAAQPGPGLVQRVGYDGKCFSIAAASPMDVSLRLFGLSGALVATVYNGRMAAGETRVGFSLEKLGGSIFLLNFVSGRLNETFKLSPLTGKTFSVTRMSFSSYLGKRAALDSLQAGKKGYITYMKELSSLTGTNNIVLETEGTGSAGATIFWDFESGALPAGAKAAALPNQGPVGQLPAVDKSRPYKGTYSCHYATMHQARNRVYMYTLPANWGPVMWVRAYMNFTPSLPINIPPDGSSHGTMFKGIYNPQRYWYETGVELGKYFLDQHIPEPPGYPEWCIYNNITPPSDMWLCLEWQYNGVDDGTGNATIPVLYINGEEVPVTRQTLWNNGFLPDKPAGDYKPVQDFIEIWLGMEMWHDWTGFDEFWFDDVAISKTRVGIR
jgi:hypothetical protein